MEERTWSESKAIKRRIAKKIRVIPSYSVESVAFFLSPIDSGITDWYHPPLYGGLAYADAVSCLRKEPDFWPYYLSRPQCPFTQVLSESPTCADFGKWVCKASPCLHAMPEIREGSESDLGQSDRLDFHQNFLWQTCHLHGGTGRFAILKVFPVYLIEYGQIVEVL